MNTSNNVQIIKDQSQEQGQVSSNDPVMGAAVNPTEREDWMPTAEPRAEAEECQVLLQLLCCFSFSKVKNVWVFLVFFFVVVPILLSFPPHIRKLPV